MKLGYSTITWGGVSGTPGGVTSVKDLFYRTAGSTADALRAIAAAGYTGTEVFDGNLLEFVNEPQRLTDLLEETGLTIVSVYTGANFIFNDIVIEEFAKIERAAAMAAAFGVQRLVVGGGAQRVEGPADGLDRCDELATAAGLVASYHPHLGTLVETPSALGKVMALSSIRFCPDTAHLAGGGGDPAELIRRYQHRLAHVHLKDWDIASSEFRPLGRGDLDFPGILRAIREAGYDDWLMLELDYYDGDPNLAAEISKRFIDRLLTQDNHSSDS
jgi:inosose dehydratase